MSLAASLAKVAAARAEFPEWYLAPDKARGWVARMGNLTVRAATLDELACTLRAAYSSSGPGSGSAT